MNKLIINDKARVNKWIYQKIGRDNPFSPESSYNAVGVENEHGELIGGVVFDAFAKDARCSMHCAGTAQNWCTKRLLKFCFEYVFNVAKCKVVINTVASDNVKSIEFTKQVGFEEVARIKDGAGEHDLVILTLHKNNCRWVRG